MGNFFWWVEVEYNAEIIVESPEQAAVNLSGLFLVNLPIAIPRGWSFDNKNVRLAFSPTRDLDVTVDYFNIKVKGDYHGFGAFVSGVASLPRIVTLDNFSIAEAKSSADAKGRKGKGKDDNQRGPRLLEMSITAKTYRYSDEAEVPKDAAGDKKGKKGKKG